MLLGAAANSNGQRLLSSAIENVPLELEKLSTIINNT